METSFSLSVSDSRKQFKSYYVVWKRNTTKQGAISDTSLNRTMQYGNISVEPDDFCPFVLFKSYYVVWKLLSKLCNDSPGATFKSYYVVWKPQRKAGRMGFF